MGATVFLTVYAPPYYGPPARQDDALHGHPCDRGKKRLLSTALMNRVHLFKPNVYQTLVSVRWHSLSPLAPADDGWRPLSENIDRCLRPIGIPPLFRLNRNSIAAPIRLAGRLNTE